MSTIAGSSSLSDDAAAVDKNSCGQHWPARSRFQATLLNIFFFPSMCITTHAPDCLSYWIRRCLAHSTNWRHILRVECHCVAWVMVKLVKYQWQVRPPMSRGERQQKTDNRNWWSHYHHQHIQPKQVSVVIFGKSILLLGVMAAAAAASSKKFRKIWRN